MINLKKKSLIIFLCAIGTVFYFAPNANAVTLYQGVVIENTGLNPFTNYTTDVSPNFNVTQFNVTNNHIYFGNKYYDLSWVGHTVNANITAFNEDQNFTLLITNTSPSNVKMVVHGLLSEVKLNGGFSPYGTGWQYINGGTDTQININSNTSVYGSFNVTGIVNQSFNLSGYVYGNTAFFYPPTIFLLSPTSINMTSIGLYNATQLLSSHNFAGGLIIHSGTLTTINWNFTDINLGSQSYKLKALVNNGTITTLIQSNTQTLDFGNQVLGGLNINATNTNVFPFQFVKTVVNSTVTKLDVLYPASYNTTCNLNYEFAGTDKTYTSLPISQATFQFKNLSNEIIDIKCFDVNTNSTGTYIIVDTTIPLVQQVKDFKNGVFGTSGSFGGAFDLITLIIIIISMIGLNRVNEAVAAVFSIFIIGACAYFDLIQWYTVISSAVAVIIIIIIAQVRKQQGF